MIKVDLFHILIYSYRHTCWSYILTYVECLQYLQHLNLAVCVYISYTYTLNAMKYVHNIQKLFQKRLPGLLQVPQATSRAAQSLKGAELSHSLHVEHCCILGPPSKTGALSKSLRGYQETSYDKGEGGTLQRTTT